MEDGVRFAGWSPSSHGQDSVKIIGEVSMPRRFLRMTGADTEVRSKNRCVWCWRVRRSQAKRIQQAVQVWMRKCGSENVQDYKRGSWEDTSIEDMARAVPRCARCVCVCLCGVQCSVQCNMRCTLFLLASLRVRRKYESYFLSPCSQLTSSLGRRTKPNGGDRYQKQATRSR